MRSLALLRLVGGEKSGSRCGLRPGGVLENMFWNIVGSEFPQCVISIENRIVLGFPLLKFGDVVVLK